MAFDANGNPTASTLYRPYGGVRYSSGTMPGSLGFTGQRNDTAVTGLDYDHARYYDPAAGGFTTADSLSLTAKMVNQGQPRDVLNRYVYVSGNPETQADPTGHIQCEADGGHCGSDDGSDTDIDKTPTKGTTFAACMDYSHCVILITGPDVSLPKRVGGFRSDVAFWNRWTTKISEEYDGDVGFILFEAIDGYHGALELHQDLAALGNAGYQGTVSVVGHSNGAAAIDTYFSMAAAWSGDQPIKHFVTLEAPSSSIPAVSAAQTVFWHRWSPYATPTIAANVYIATHGIVGINAFDVYDLASGPQPLLAGAPYPVAGGSPGDQLGNDPNNPHLYLVYNPDPFLVAFV